MMEKNKKITEAFEMPNAEVIIFETEDIITASGGSGGSGGGGANEGPLVPLDM